MTETTFEDIADDLDRATDLESDAAVELLRSAQRDLQRLQANTDVDQNRHQELETRLEQRIREIENRDAYGGGLGKSLNPEEDDAP